jgi:hypothetical protein
MTGWKSIADYQLRCHVPQNTVVHFLMCAGPVVERVDAVLHWWSLIASYEEASCRAVGTLSVI